MNETSSSELSIQPQILALTGGFTLALSWVLSPVYPLLPDLPATQHFWVGCVLSLLWMSWGWGGEINFHTGHHAGSLLEDWLRVPGKQPCVFVKQILTPFQRVEWVVNSLGITRRVLASSAGGLSYDLLKTDFSPKSIKNLWRWFWMLAYLKPPRCI